MLGDKFRYFLLLLLTTTVLGNSGMHASDDFLEISRDNEVVRPGYRGNPAWQPRIVGGNPAPLYPFMAQVIDLEGGGSCGGSLISKHYVLTAAHCCSLQRVLRYRVIYNSDRLLEGRRNAISSMIVHPQYDAEKMENDICILRLVYPADDVEVFARLDDGSFSPEGADANVVGFGLVNVIQVNGSPGLRDEISHELREVISPIASLSACKELYGHGSIDERIICLGYVNGLNPNGNHSGVCYGDSGGPAFVRDGDDYVEIGVASFSSGCGVVYDGYVRVSAYRDWILDVVGQCSAYVDAHDGYICVLPDSIGVVASMSMSGTVSVLSASLMLMITAFVPFSLF